MWPLFMCICNLTGASNVRGLLGRLPEKANTTIDECVFRSAFEIVSAF